MLPSDSGHSIEEFSTNEADESLPTLDGDTPDPLQGLIPVGTLMESADATITPMKRRTQGSPLQYTTSPIPQTYAPHSALLVDVLRKKRLRKIILRRHSRNELRTARARKRWANGRFWITIACTMLILLLLFLLVGSTAGYVSYRFVHTTQDSFGHSVVTLRDLLPLDNLKIYDSKGVLIDQLADNGIH